jgi:hypothetical protein
MTDRRRRPTPILSRYWLVGRRRGSGDPDEYVDRYRPSEWALVLSVLVLSAADLVLTLWYLEMGGEEANPVMALALRGGYLTFTIVKMGMTLLGLTFVLLHIRFRRVRLYLIILLAMNIALIAYHVYLRILLAG